MMFNRLLDAHDIVAELDALALNVGNGGIEFGILRPAPFDGGFLLELTGGDFLLAGFQFGQGPFERIHFPRQVLPLQRVQARFHGSLFFHQFPVALGRPRLPLEMLQLPLQLAAHVRKSLQVLAGSGDTRRGFLAPLAILRNAGGLLDVDPQLFRPGLDQAADHALLDDGITARAESGAEKKFGDVPPPATGSIERVDRIAAPFDFALDRDFRVAGVFALQALVGVVEYEFHRGQTDRIPNRGTVEDDVGHLFAAQVARRTFSHDPAHGVDHVRFAAAVGSDYGANVRGEIDGGGVNE